LHDAPALGREIERARRDCRSGRRLDARQRLGIGAERQHLGNQRCERAVVQHDIGGGEDRAIGRRERQAGTVLDKPDLAGKNARKLRHRLTVAHRPSSFPTVPCANTVHARIGRRICSHKALQNSRFTEG
jgi:hypothetical protein